MCDELATYALPCHYTLIKRLTVQQLQAYFTYMLMITTIKCAKYCLLCAYMRCILSSYITRMSY